MTDTTRRTTEHGVFLEIMGLGVLITGDSGIGKSELALGLITRGQRLIADDAPDFVRTSRGVLEGSCSKGMADFMEVRGLGVLNVRALFGARALKARAPLQLIVHLEAAAAGPLPVENRLRPERGARCLLGVPVPRVTLAVSPWRNLPLLVECIVQDHLLRMDGYDAASELAEKLQQAAPRRRRR